MILGQLDFTVGYTLCNTARNNIAVVAGQKLKENLICCFVMSRTQWRLFFKLSQLTLNWFMTWSLKW